MNHIRKNHSFIAIMLTTICFGQVKKQKFKLNGMINDDYSGYIYLYCQNKKDSCLVKNNQFYFEGKVFDTESACLSTKKPTICTDFYLENENIAINISISSVTIKGYDFDKTTINSLVGTQTILIQNDYENFKKEHSSDTDWKSKHYAKLDEIVTKYPKNKYSQSLLSQASWDSSADIKKLRVMYKKLNAKYQNPLSMEILKKNLYPIEDFMVGKPIIDFQLPNENDEMVNTKNYRGSLLLIDFWASWCTPCRKQLPQLITVYDAFKNENFKILGVSIDKDKEKWLQAKEKEGIPWDNVNENKDFSGEVAKKYQLTGVPTNFLIDETGKIIAYNLTLEKLESFLKEKYRK